MPKRIQRKRVEGWRMPEGAIYVGRPTRWGNPYDWHEWVYCSAIDPYEAKQWAVEQFRLWLNGEIDGNEKRREEILTHLHELKGKDLACWCNPFETCHADVLIEMVNLRE